jgi:hypothetical protein
MAFYPAKYGTGVYGTSRYAVIKSTRLPSRRTITHNRKVASRLLDGDTGQPTITWTTSTITAYIRPLDPEELEAFTGGTVDESMMLLISQDGLEEEDRVTINAEEWEIQQSHPHYDNDSFAYWEALIRKVII